MLIFKRLCTKNVKNNTELESMCHFCAAILYKSKGSKSWDPVFSTILGKISVLGCTIVKSYKLNLTRTLTSIVKYAMKLHAQISTPQNGNYPIYFVIQNCDTVYCMDNSNCYVWLERIVACDSFCP